MFKILLRYKININTILPFIFLLIGGGFFVVQIIATINSAYVLITEVDRSSVTLLIDEGKIQKAAELINQETILN